MKALLLYYSATGNTAKVAEQVRDGLEEGGIDVKMMKVADAEGESYFDYDLVCLGVPSINWHVPAPVERFLKTNFNAHRKAGKVVPGAPTLPGKHALLFCTYCGTHTGLNEAVPALKYAGQFFEHIGFTIEDEWYILGEYVGNEPNNRFGRMGDVTGRPNGEDLARVRSAAVNLAKRLL